MFFGLEPGKNETAGPGNGKNGNSGPGPTKTKLLDPEGSAAP